MPEYKAFKALRPKPEFIAQVSAKSTDFNSQDLLADALRNNPYTFHHVTKSHLNYSGAFQEPEKFLPFAARFIAEMKEQGVFVKEETDSFYVYRQTRDDGRVFKGLIGLASIEDYLQNKIKKHEETRPSRTRFMIELFKTTKVLGDPTLLSFKSEKTLPLEGAETLYDFYSVDGKRHEISRISNSGQIEEIRNILKNVSAFYIADGHHRAASMAEFREKYPQLDNHAMLSLLMPEEEFEISSFHRLIKSVEAISPELLLKKLRQHFIVSNSATSLFNPEEKGAFGLYCNQRWYSLKLNQDEPLIDVELLEKYIVRKIYGITDSRTDSQISFLSNTEGRKSLTNLVDSGAFDIAYTLKPCSFADVRKISDRNLMMPPKSTYIEPKLRAGMLIQEF